MFIFIGLFFVFYSGFRLNEFIKPSNTMPPKRSEDFLTITSKRQLRKPATCHFPDDDTLGVILSFLTALEICRGGIYRVSKGFNHVLKTLAHSWGSILDLSFVSRLPNMSHTTYAWHRVQTLDIIPRDRYVRSRGDFNFWPMDLDLNPNLACMTTLTSLRHVNLSYCCHLTNDNLVHLASLNLESLNLKICSRISDAGLAHISAMSLKRLDVSCCDITDEGLALLSNLSLERLCLAGCWEITDAGLDHLRSLPLKYLSLRCCPKITDDGMAAVALIKSLQFLDLSLTHITEVGVTHLSSLGLRTLNLPTFERQLWAPQMQDLHFSFVE